MAPSGALCHRHDRLYDPRLVGLYYAKYFLGGDAALKTFAITIGHYTYHPSGIAEFLAAFITVGIVGNILRWWFPPGSPSSFARSRSFAGRS